MSLSITQLLLWTLFLTGRSASGQDVEPTTKETLGPLPSSTLPVTTTMTSPATSPPPPPSPANLYQHLMTGYEKAVRPVKNASYAVNVSLGVTLVRLHELNMKTKTLSVRLWLNLQWVDEQLQWDPKTFGHVTQFSIPSSKIWLPDITVYNSAERDQFTVSGYGSRDGLNAMVTYLGNVTLLLDVQVSSSCTVDPRYWPFDRQMCHLKFASWVYHGNDLNLEKFSERIDVGNYETHSEFELIDARLKFSKVYYTCCPEFYPDVTAYIKLARKPSAHMLSVIAPCIILSVLTLCVFRLDPASKEKITLGIMILLIYFVFNYSAESKVPQTYDHIPLICCYISFLMLLSSLSVLLAVFVINVHSGCCKCRLPRCITSCLGALCCSRPSRSVARMNTPEHRALLSDELNKYDQLIAAKQIEIEQSDNLKEWQQLAKFVDCVFFWLFLFATVVANVLFLLFVLGQDD